MTWAFDELPEEDEPKVETNPHISERFLSTTKRPAPVNSLPSATARPVLENFLLDVRRFCRGLPAHRQFIDECLFIRPGQGGADFSNLLVFCRLPEYLRTSAKCSGEEGEKVPAIALDASQIVTRSKNRLKKFLLALSLYCGKVCAVRKRHEEKPQGLETMQVT